MPTEERAVEILRDLLRFDTTNPPGNERPAIDYIARLLRDEAGVEPEIFEPAPGRANLVARIPAGNGGGGAEGRARGLLLTSHVDVVAAEASKWRHPPFTGELADGCIWGRGAVDMKGMTALELAVFLAVRQSGEKLGRDVVLSCFADEEAGSRFGSRWMVVNEPEHLRAECALTEVGGFSISVAETGRRLYPVQVAEKGFCWMKMRVRGEPGHGSIPNPESAVRKLARAIERLTSARGEAEFALRVTPAAAGFVRALGAELGFAARTVLEGLLHGSTHGLALRAVRGKDKDRARLLRAMLHNTATPTGLRAGVKANVIPSEAEATIDGRVIPGSSDQDLAREIRAAIGPELAREIELERIDGGPPSAFAPESPLFRTIEAVLPKHDPEGRAVPWLTVGFTDGCYLSRIGIRAHGFTPLKLPPDLPFVKLFHGHDERVPVEGFRFGFRVLRDIVTSYLRLP